LERLKIAYKQVPEKAASEPDTSEPDTLPMAE